MRLKQDKRIKVVCYSEALSSRHSNTYLPCVYVCVCEYGCTCSRADCMVGLWRPPRAAGEAEGEKPGTPGKDSKLGNPLLPGG